MSLKRSIDEELAYLGQDVVDAVEDLKNGKKHSKQNLYKFVLFYRIDKQFYKWLVKEYYKVNVRKEKKKRKLYLFGYPVKEWVPVLEFISIIGAIGIILSSADNSLWVKGASVYLLFAYFVHHCSANYDIERKDNEIAELKHEIYRLKDLIKGNKRYIEILEKKLGITDK